MRRGCTAFEFVEASCWRESYHRRSASKYAFWASNNVSAREMIFLVLAFSAAVFFSRPMMRERKSGPSSTSLSKSSSARGLES